MRFVPVLAALIACGGPVEVGKKGPGEPTYHKDVRPVMEQTCVRCHASDNIGPFPLTTYEEVSSVAPLVADAVAERRMPPWLAGPDCNEYEADWSLTQDEIDAIVDWAANGAPEGDEKDFEPLPDELGPGGLPRVDYVLKLPEPYVPAQSEDDYRCFVLDWPDPSIVTSVTGFEVVPDDDRTVHHVIAYIIPTVWADQYAALDGADGTPGYTCFGGVGGPAPQRGSSDSDSVRWLGGWAPGGMAGTFPALPPGDGVPRRQTGIPVQGGSKIVIQVHYHPLPEEPDRADQSEVHVMVDPLVPQDMWAAIIPFTSEDWVDNHTMPIAANDDEAWHGYELEMDTPFTILTAGFHMHTKGRSGRLSVIKDSEETCLLDVPRWDFEWQRSYRLSRPVDVDPGDKLAIECTWDNDTSNELNWGDGTNDEMCLGPMYVIGR